MEPSSSSSTPPRAVSDPADIVEHSGQASVEDSDIELAGYYTAESDFTDMEEKMEYQDEEEGLVAAGTLSSSSMVADPSPSRPFRSFTAKTAMSSAELEERLKQELLLIRKFDR